jgi:L-2-hydroxyglutarate oxidase LhgO
MEKTFCIVIGAGVVGLAAAERISRSTENVIVVEQEESFGQHASSRNSEVIHSGIYYPENTLKAKLCIKGKRMLYDFLEIEKLPFIKCGKYIIASAKDEIPEIERLYALGRANGAEDLAFISGMQIREKEPLVSAHMGIHAPTTGIFDAHHLMSRLQGKIEDNGAFVSYRTRVTEIEKSPSGYIVTMEDGFQMESEIIVNAAGLYSDRIASIVGMDIDAAGYRIHFSKGEYYRTNKIKGMKSLVYPVPASDGSSLGIHTRLHMDGSVAFGPNAYYTDRIDYGMDESCRREFFTSIIKFLDIEEKDLVLSDCGIRAKIQAPGKGEKDFVIRNESDRGLDGFINLIGIESPGLTSCLAIAEMVGDLIKGN